MWVSCLVGYIINVDCGVDVGHVGHLFGVLCAQSAHTVPAYLYLLTRYIEIETKV